MILLLIIVGITALWFTLSPIDQEEPVNPNDSEVITNEGSDANQKEIPEINNSDEPEVNNKNDQSPSTPLQDKKETFPTKKELPIAEEKTSKIHRDPANCFSNSKGIFSHRSFRGSEYSGDPK